MSKQEYYQEQAKKLGITVEEYECFVEYMDFEDNGDWE